MTTPADDHDDAQDEPQIGFVTPFGAFSSADDLPPQIRQHLEESLASLPEPLRNVFARILGVDTADEPTPDTTGVVGPHGPGCTCDHREYLWDILDRAFPTEPHLWQAAAAIFTLSSTNPDTLDDAERRAALDTATLHLQRHAALHTPPLSPTEQLVTKFREQMDDM